LKLGSKFAGGLHLSNSEVRIEIRPQVADLWTNKCFKIPDGNRPETLGLVQLAYHWSTVRFDGVR